MRANDAAAVPAIKSPAKATACTPPTGAHAARIVVSNAYPVVSHPNPSTSLRMISAKTHNTGRPKAAVPDDFLTHRPAAAGTAYVSANTDAITKTPPAATTSPTPP